MAESKRGPSDIPRERLERFAESCREVVRQGLVSCSSGNASERESEELMLATSTRTWLGEMEADQVAVCRVEDGECVNGLLPTVEIGFHAGVLRARPDMNVVLHVQTPHATAIGCLPPSGRSFHVIPEVPYYIGTVGRVAYAAPGSRRLAETVSKAMRTHDLAIMENHGLVVAGKDFRDAIQKASFFELACRILLIGGDDVRPIPNKETESLLELHRQKGSASTKGA